MTVPFHQFIADNKQAIVDRFVTSVRMLAPDGAGRAVIVDHIPQFLDGLVAALASVSRIGSRTSLPTLRDAARDHGEQRLEQDFSLSAVIREYGVLRHVILQLAGDAHVAVSTETFDVFAQAIHSAVITAVMHFTESRQREVALERQRLRTSLAILPVGVTITDASGGMVEVNEMARQIWGHPPKIESCDEISAYRGRHPGTDRPVQSDEWPVARTILRGETVHDFEVDIETLDQGEKKTVAISSAPVRRDDGVLIGAVTVTVDVTSRARRMSDAAQALRVRDEVMSIVSHDLRNPLGAVLLSAQRLLRLAQAQTTAVPTDDLLPMVQNITRSCERMQRLLDDLLDVARIEAGRFSIVEGRFSLTPMIAETVELLRPIADTKHIALHIDDDIPRDVTIPGDRDRIMQVLSNLIGNALKFTPEGGVVTVSAKDTTDAVEVCVSDTGPGIPPELLSKIWDRFFTTQQDRGTGTGLGLAIAQGIIDEHGGQVWVESKPGLGATFHFTLPKASHRRGSKPTKPPIS